MKEMADRRTLQSKTYKKLDGSHLLRIGTPNLHFVSKGRLRDIGLRAKNSHGHYLIDNAPFVLRILREAPAYRYSSRQGAVEVALEKAGEARLNGYNYFHISENRYFWRGVAQSTDCILRPSRAGCDAYIVLRSCAAPKTWVWDIKGSRALVRPFRGYDAKGNLLELIESRKKNKIYVQWTGRVTSREFLRKKEKHECAWHEDAAYPVVIDPTVNETIVAGGDDVHNVGTSLVTNGSYIRAGDFFGYAFAGLRFQSLGIPQGAVISSATLTIYVTGAVGGGTTTFIHGSDVDDAAPWSTANLPSNITKTTANASLTGSTLSTRTVGVTGIVQEIIDRTGWGSGNDLALMLSGTESNKWILISALEGVDTNEAQLDIVYEAGASEGIGSGHTFPLLLNRKSLIN